MAPNLYGRDTMRRRRRREFMEEAVEVLSGVASFKSVPSESPPSVYPPLFPGACSKCSPLTSITSLDPTSSKLGHVDLLEWRKGRNLVHQLMLSYYQLQYSGGVIISPGQLEVLERVGRGTVVLLVPPVKLSSTDLTILCLSLAHHHSLPVPLVAGLDNSWADRLLVKAGLASHFQAESQLSQGRLVITQFDSGLVSSLRETDLEVFCVPALVCHELGGRGVRVEVGQPMAVVEDRLEQVRLHLSVSTQRLARLSPSQLVAFLLQSGLCPRQPSVSELSAAIKDLLLLLRNKNVELTVRESCQEEIARAGVSGLGGHINDAGEVHIGWTETELWLLSRPVESHLVGESMVALVVLLTARPGLLSTRETGRGGGPTVSQEEVLDKAGTLALLTGLDTTALAPCEDLQQVLGAGLGALEMLDCIGNIQLLKPSQHGSSGRHSRPRYSTDYDQEDCERTGVGMTTRLAVGLTNRGRRCLTWLGGILRYRLTNLGYTIRAMQRVRETKGASMQEIIELVSREMNNKKDRGWLLSEKSLAPEVTRDSVLALAQNEVVNILDRPDIQLVQVTHMFASGEGLEEMINLILEF